MNTSNSGVGKYYVTEESMIFFTLVLVNKPVKLIESEAYIFL
jgi:hypothetical protein